MSSSLRIAFYSLVGLSAILALWPILEIIVYFQGNFTYLLLYSLAVGALAGLFLGGAFGSCEGLIQHTKRKLFKGLISGLIIGSLGGAVGILAGQAVSLFIGTNLSSTTQSLSDMAFPLAKALGWALFGVFIGSAEGLRSRSLAKIRNGIIGGVAGGFLGGFAFESAIHFQAFSLALAILVTALLCLIAMAFLIQGIRLGLTRAVIISLILIALAAIIILSLFIFPSQTPIQLAFARLYGLLILAILIGIFYGLVEKRLSKAMLIALNGPAKGKEILITQKLTSIGSAEEATVTISGYTELEDEHAIIRQKKGELVLENRSKTKGTYLNDERITETVINDGDVIRIGEVQFLCKKK